MTLDEFRQSLTETEPPAGLTQLAVMTLFLSAFVIDAAGR